MSILKKENVDTTETKKSKDKAALQGGKEGKKRFQEP
jgi:hypothetical protein